MKIKVSKLIPLMFFIGVIIGIGLMMLIPEPTSLEFDEVISITDREYFDIVHEALQNAETSIHMIQFELNYYNSTRYKDSNLNFLVKDLMNAAENGIDVKVIVDEYDSDANRVVNMLREAGAIAKFDNTKITTHNKLIIIDGEIVIIGSTNWSHYALDRNHEANVMVKSKALASDFEEYFEELWQES